MSLRFKHNKITGGDIFDNKCYENHVVLIVGHSRIKRRLNSISYQTSHLKTSSFKVRLFETARLTYQEVLSLINLFLKGPFLIQLRESKISMDAGAQAHKSSSEICISYYMFYNYF